MSLKVYTASNQEALTLELAPFAKGGEGRLYKIRSPKTYENYAAKIYHKNKRDPQRQQKINYLIQHPPQFDHPEQAKLVVWPTDVLHQNGRFVGYLMSLAQGKKLETLCTPKLPKKLGSEWKRLEFEQAEAMQLRIKICFNLAVALYHIHATQHYVIVDLKADNILIRPNGLISIVDMDSIEVVNGNKVLFPAPVATPEFTPPEFYEQTGHREGPILETWDRFAMAVIFYKVLFGIHPFAGSSKVPFEKYVTLADKIEQGLFVQTPEQQKHFSVIPQPHEQFARLSESLRSLFLQCFDTGHKNPVMRPSAEDWCIALSEGSGITLVTHRPLISHLPEFQNTTPTSLKIDIPQWSANNIYNFVLDKLSGQQRMKSAVFFSLNPKTSDKTTALYKRFSSILIYITLFFISLTALVSLISIFTEQYTGVTTNLGIISFILFYCSLLLVYMKDGYNANQTYKKNLVAFWEEKNEDILSKISTENKGKLKFFEQEDLHRFMHSLNSIEEEYLNIQHSISNIELPSNINLQQYIQEQDKKIIQISRAERKALQELKEVLNNDQTWQQFKGQTLEYKLNNVEPYYNQYDRVRLEEELQSSYKTIDAQFNQLAEQQTKAYHKELQKFDRDTKAQTAQLEQQYTQQLETLGSDAPIYKAAQDSLKVAQEDFKKQLNSLHKELTKDINNLEQQQHKNLEQLNKDTEQELKNASPNAKKQLLAQAEKKASTFIAMTHKNIDQLQIIYKQRQEKLSQKWLPQQEQLDSELLEIMQVFISKNRKEKALKLQLQQLQHQKRKDKILAELKFIYNRQNTIDELQRTKQAATKQYNQAIAGLHQEIQKSKLQLEQLHNYYQNDVTAIKAKYDEQYQTVLKESEQYILEQQLQQESQAQAFRSELEQRKIDLEQQIISNLGIDQWN
ncbi:MAG: hypothetical protein GY810_13920 [Aureispira sp.]|nr:hypothetical protein [Aureispira sp.]